MSLLTPCPAQTCSEPTPEGASFYQQRKIIALWGRDQDGDYVGNATYLVPCNIMIDTNKTMTLGPGAKVLFAKDTRIVVRGRLICKGLPTAFVTLMPLDSAGYYLGVQGGEQRLWDGVFLEDGGEIEMRYTAIDSSKYGISADKRIGRIVLDSVLFSGNRYADVRIGEKTLAVNDGKFLTKTIEHGEFAPAPPAAGGGPHRARPRL